MNIEAIVTEMQNYTGSPETRRTVFSEKYPEFYERYPGLFFKASEDGMDMNMLRFMLSKVGMSGGEEVVGKRLYSDYVSPTFTKLTKTENKK